MFESLGEVKARAVAGRYGNPLRSATVILVAGPYGKSTTLAFLQAILEESGRPATLLSSVEGYDDSENGIFRAAATLKNQKKSIVLIEVTDRLIDSPALRVMPIDTLILTGDDERSNKLLSLSPKHVVGPTSLSVPPGSVEPYQHISFGTDDTAEAKIDDVKLYAKGTELRLTIDHQTKLDVATYLAGRASAETLAIAVAAAYVIGVDLPSMQEGVANLEGLANHFELVSTGAPYRVFIDGARHDTSLTLAVQSAKALTQRRLLVVFDATPSDAVLDEAKSLADRVFAVSDDSQIRTDIDIARSLKGAVEKATRGAKKGDSILLVGASFVDMTNVERDELLGSSQDSA